MDMREIYGIGCRGVSGSRQVTESSDVFSLGDQRNSRTLNRNTRGKRRALTNNWKSSMEDIDLEDIYRDVLVWSLKRSVKSPELT